MGYPAVTKDTPAAEFLALAGLSKFVTLFEEDGFDDVESLLCIKEQSDWEELAGRGFKRGHKLKLLSKLKELGLG